jgi:hypothetical protein
MQVVTMQEGTVLSVILQNLQFNLDMDRKIFSLGKNRSLLPGASSGLGKDGNIAWYAASNLHEFSISYGQSRIKRARRSVNHIISF